MLDGRNRRLQPWVAAHVTPCPPAVSNTITLLGGCFQPQLVSAFSAFTSSMMPPQTLLVVPQTPSQKKFVLETKTLSTIGVSPPNRFQSPERLPPIDPVRFVPRLRSTRFNRAATGTAVLPPRAQLPTCVHLRNPYARPNFCRLFADGPQATCRLSISAIERSTSAPTNSPDLVAIAKAYPRATE